VKQGHIYIHGTIGSYIDPEGSEVKGVELLDVISQVKAQAPSQNYLVHIKSPGGLVDAGNQIYDYLESLKASAQVDTISDGDVGSIATKIFLVGQNRTIIDGHEFFIHNPWTQTKPGDSNQIALELHALKQTEAELRTFYQQKTQITEQGLKGLMDVETGMSADQAVTLGFATSKAKASKVKAFALLTTQNMPKENLTVGQRFGQLLDMIVGKSQIKALDLEAEGGKKISVSSEDPANLVGADAIVTDEAGNSAPAPDGEHKLADGRILVVSGGKVAEVKPAAAAQAPAPTAAPAAAATPAPTVPQPSALETELQNKVKALETELAAMKAVNIDDKINAAIDGLKNSLVSGKTPTKAINTNGQGTVSQGPKLSPIQQKMVALQQKEK
jgi:ATP-dependent protease ClpP protease subunit